MTPIVASKLSFKGGLVADRFEKSQPEALTKEEQRILDIINAKRPEDNKITLSKKTLEILVTAYTNQKTIPYCYNILGKAAYLQAIREYFIDHLATKNSFDLTIHQTSFKKATEKIARQSGFSQITQDKLPKQVIGGFRRFLGVVREHEGQDTVNKFLEPFIEAELHSADAHKLVDMATDYFENKDKVPHKLEVVTAKLVDGRTRAEVFVDGELRARIAKRKKLHAVSKAVRRVLEEVDFLPNEADSVQHKKPLIYNDKPTETAETILKNMFFLRPTDKLDEERDKDLINALLIAANPEAKKINLYLFQRLEFLGDSIANNFAARFVLSKKLDGLTADSIYQEMISNTNYARFASSLKLVPPLGNCAHISEVKSAADTFEATVAALYTHFSEERVYNYLKALFELKYNEIISKQGQQ